MSNKLPKHTNPTGPRRDRRTGDEFVARAPYNFVPLPDKVVSAPQPLLDHDSYAEAGLSGEIICQLETCSPLYIRGMLTPNESEAWGDNYLDNLTPEQRQRKAEFFSIDGKTPRLPGSSLRGLIRSLVEIITYSKMHFVNASPTFTFRAVAAAKDDPLAGPYRQIVGMMNNPLARPGYLHKQGKEWFILPAKLPIGLSNKPWLTVQDKNIPSGAIKGFRRLTSDKYIPQWHSVSFDIQEGNRGKYVAKIGGLDDNFRYRGVMVCSGNMSETAGGKTPRTSHTIILEKDEKAKRIPINDQAVEDYKAGLTPYQKTELEMYWSGGELGCLKDGAPVFFLTSSGGKSEVSYFGHSPNFRIPARLNRVGVTRAATPLDFVPDDVRKGERPDFAEAIFGWVEDTKREGGVKGQRAGRVFVEDGVMVEGQDEIWYHDKEIALHTLSGPKVTTFQHYLVQSTPDQHNPNEKQSLAHYGTNPEETAIRGHKLYWHKGKNPDIEADIKELDHLKQLTVARPIKAGVKFQFTVRFENLHKTELGALLWALHLPGEEGKTYRHKLGMGKPLGMGAVAICPKLILRQPQQRYKQLFTGNRWNEGEESADSTPYIEQFESLMMTEIAPREKHLRDIERIKQLLTMLAWREDSAEWREKTRYMGVEQGQRKLNEYKERPVLPTPLGVLSMSWPQGALGRAENRPIPTPTPKPARPSLTIGETVDGIVYIIDQKDLYAQVPLFGNMLAFLPAGKWSSNYVEGNPIKLRVEGIEVKGGEKMIIGSEIVPDYQTGIVKSYRKGQGTIRLENDEVIFVRQKSLAGALTKLEPDDKVRFKVMKSPKGLEAYDVELM